MVLDVCGRVCSSGNPRDTSRRPLSLFLFTHRDTPRASPLSPSFLCQSKVSKNQRMKMKQEQRVSSHASFVMISYCLPLICDHLTSFTHTKTHAYTCTVNRAENLFSAFHRHWPASDPRSSDCDQPASRDSLRKAELKSGVSKQAS